MLNLDTLDLKRLRAFQLVARNGSLRVAANRLKQSIPAISGKIRKLEQELGFDLFERLPNRLVLTLSGERFLREVEGIFERAEQALSTLEARSPEQRLSISVGSDHAWYFAPKIRDFLARYPAVTLGFRVYKSAEALEALDRGQVEISFGIFPDLPRTLERRAIVATTLSLAYNPQEFGGRRKAPSLADLARHRLIVPPPSTVTRRLIETHLRPSIERAASLIEVPTCETAATFVEMGVGPAIVHTLCIERMLSRHVQAVDLGPRSGTLAFSAVFRKGALRAPLAQALIDQITESEAG
ncbi:MAG: DNA-binding transcriptional regulator, LysR family [Hyphomicrobiales bacterium]|nr:DNA-binding transcriptional regulator, LysR family [Hyphomicrobiales bacterium]